MAKTTITLTNSNHNTSVNVRVFEGQPTLLEKQTIYRIRKSLCNVDNCTLCKGELSLAGESNPPVEVKSDDIYILYKMNNVNNTNSDSVMSSDAGETRIKRAKMSDNDRAEKEKDTNYIHFTELEAKIMASGLEIDEKSKLFDFIRAIRNEERDAEGLESL